MNKTYMTIEELKLAIVELYGQLHGGQRQLAAEMGKHEVTVSRWVNGSSPIEELPARFIRLLVDVKRGKKKRPAIAKMRQEFAELL